MNTSSPARRGRIAAAGIVAGAALALAFPLAASAHVHVTPEDAHAAATTSVAFSFSHGCEDSPTTALIVDIPEGVTNVVPVAQAGWTIDRTTAENGTITQVAYRADQPVETGLKAELAMDLRFGEELANTAVAFPVTQECVTGSTAWTELTVDGEAEPEAPAPVVQVGDIAEEGEGHGSSGHSDTAESEDAAAAAGDASEASATTATSSDAGSATALWLGGAGLGLGVIALIVAITALVRRRA